MPPKPSPSPAPGPDPAGEALNPDRAAEFRATSPKTFEECPRVSPCYWDCTNGQEYGVVCPSAGTKYCPRERDFCGECGDRDDCYAYVHGDAGVLETSEGMRVVANLPACPKCGSHETAREGDYYLCPCGYAWAAYVETPRPLPPEGVCPYCRASQAHALRHWALDHAEALQRITPLGLLPPVNAPAGIEFVRCLPHRLLQPVSQYLREFAENAVDPARCCGGLFENPATLLSKVEEVRVDFYADAPEDSTLWGCVLAYLPLVIPHQVAGARNSAYGWHFHLLLSGDYERGQYNNRRLGVAFSAPAPQPLAGHGVQYLPGKVWGYLPDPALALALASCVGWANACLVQDTNTGGGDWENTLAPALADLPAYTQRESCPACEAKPQRPPTRARKPRAQRVPVAEGEESLSKA